MGDKLNSKLSEDLQKTYYYKDQVEPILSQVNDFQDKSVRESIRKIEEKFTKETTIDELSVYMEEINKIIINYEASKGTAILASQIERTQNVNQKSVTQEPTGYGDIELIDPETGEKIKEKIIGVGAGVVSDVTDAWEKGKEAYEEAKNENEKKEQEKLQAQILEFQEELKKLEFSGNLSNEEFEKQLDLILKNDKFKDISDDLKSDIRKNLLKLKGTKDTELKKVNDSIDSLYNPDKPNSIVYKDENGNEKVVEFNSPEEAQNFIKNLKVLAEEEFNNSWGDAIYDFFGDASEWVLPFTTLRKIINGKFEFWSTDFPLGIVEAYVWYAITAFVFSGGIASIKRRGGDILGGINTKNKKYNFSAETVTALKTMTPLDINSEAGKDFLELKNRMETLNKLYEFADTIPDLNEKHKILKEIKELDKKFFLRRSDTFDLKAFKIMERLGLEYDIRVFIFEGARARFPILHRIPKIGQWGWIQAISKDGLEIRKSEDFVNYIKAKDIENTDGLRNFYDIDRDNNFTLKQEKLDGLLAVAELEWKNAGISDSDITKYKKNIEKYIVDLKGKKEHTASLNRNIQLFIERPLEMNDIKEKDFLGKITNEIDKIDEKLKELNKDFVTPHPVKKKELNRQLEELQIFQRYIAGNNWFGTEAEFNDTIKNITENKGEAKAKILSGFTVNNDYLKNSFKIVSDIEVAKENFGKYLDKKIPGTNISRGEKINTLIEYYLPTEKESETREKFEKLKNKNLKTEDDYKNLLKNILGINLDIDTHLLKVAKIENSYKLSDSGNIGEFINSNGEKVSTNFKDSGSIKNAIIQHYGLDLGKETGLISIIDFSRMEKEIKKISDTISDGNQYTIGQLTYLIEQIKSGQNYDDLKNIDWFSIHNLDLGKTGEYFRKPFEDEKKIKDEEAKKSQEESKDKKKKSKKGKKGKKNPSSNPQPTQQQNPTNNPNNGPTQGPDVLKQQQLLELEKLENRVLATLEISSLSIEDKKAGLKFFRENFREGRNKINSGISIDINDLQNKLNDRMKTIGIGELLTKQQINSYLMQKSAILGNLEIRGIKFDPISFKLTGNLDNRAGIPAEEASLLRFLKFISKGF